MIAFVNPTKGKPKRKASTPKSGAKAKRTTKPATKRAAQKGASMAKKRRSAAQKAATCRMIAANKGKRHRNPSNHKKHRYASRKRRSVCMPTKRHGRRNPTVLGGSLMNEILSVEGLKMIAAGVAGATLPVMVQAKLMPGLTGYTKTAARAVVAIGGAWALGKYVSKKVGLAFFITGAASAVAEAINTWQANSIVQPVTKQQQAVSDAFAENPVLMDSLAGTSTSAWQPLNEGGWAPLSDGYGPALTDGYQMTLADHSAFSQPFS